VEEVVKVEWDKLCMERACVQDRADMMKKHTDKASTKAKAECQETMVIGLLDVESRGTLKKSKKLVEEYESMMIEMGKREVAAEQHEAEVTRQAWDLKACIAGFDVGV
jgi:hypothetical protein